MMVVAKRKGDESKRIEIERPNIQRLTVTLVGTTPLLTNRLVQEAMGSLPGSGKEKAKAGKRNKDKAPIRSPDQVYRDSRYMISPTKHGFPATGVKKAMISAVGMLGEAGESSLSMKRAKPMFTTRSTTGHKYMELRFKSVKDSVDVARNRKGGRIETHRACYTGWECDCVIEFNADFMSPDTVLNLLMLAGQVGIGSHRPECDGMFGMFEVKETAHRRKRKIA